MEPVCELGGHAKERDLIQKQEKPSQPEQILNFQKSRTLSDRTYLSFGKRLTNKADNLPL